jgi:hypothetical protein
VRTADPQLRTRARCRSRADSTTGAAARPSRTDARTPPAAAPPCPLRGRHPRSPTRRGSG